MKLEFTLVYAAREKNARLELLNHLEGMGKRMDTPSIVLGDFNFIANLNERVGNPPRLNEITSLRNCTGVCGIYDLKSNGRFFTWNNKKSKSSRVMSKIDKVMGNHQWEESYPNVEVTYHPEGEFNQPLYSCASSTLSLQRNLSNSIITGVKKKTS